MEPPPTEPPNEGLSDLLASLPEEQKEVLLLRFVDGMTMDEIAAALQVPSGTVKSRLHYALKAFRTRDAAKKFFDA